MAKITKTGEQYRINIPKEVILLTGWDENTEIIIFPHQNDINAPVTENTAILMKKINMEKKNGVASQ